MLSALVLPLLALTLVQVPDAAGAALSPECLAIGVAVSFFVSLLKRVKVVGNHPKRAAFVLNTLVGLFPMFIHGTNELHALVACVLAQFSASVATYETVTAPLRRRVESGGAV